MEREGSGRKERIGDEGSDRRTGKSGRREEEGREEEGTGDRRGKYGERDGERGQGEGGRNRGEEGGEKREGHFLLVLCWPVVLRLLRGQELVPAPDHSLHTLLLRFAPEHWQTSRLCGVCVCVCVCACVYGVCVVCVCVWVVCGCV